MLSRFSTCQTPAARDFHQRHLHVDCGLLTKGIDFLLENMVTLMLTLERVVVHIDGFARYVLSRSPCGGKLAIIRILREGKATLGTSQSLLSVNVD